MVRGVAGGSDVLLVGVGQFGVSMCGPVAQASGWADPHIVLVDTEPKAMACAAAASLRRLRRVCAAAASGAANNFGLGYHTYGDSGAAAAALDAVRAVLEAGPIRVVVVLQSLAGGSGSGLGTALTEQMVDRGLTSAAVLLNVVCFPHSDGDVSVQSYNAVLALSKLAQSSDGIVVSHNDDARDVCNRLLLLSQACLSDMNQVMARNIASVLCPTQADALSAAEPLDAHQLVSHVYSHPSLRFACVRRLPEVRPQSRSFTQHQWPFLVKHLRQMQVAASAVEEGIDWSISTDSRLCNKAIALAVFVRGDAAHSADLTPFSEARLYAGCRPNLLKLYNDEALPGLSRSAAALCNDASIAAPMQQIRQRAARLLSANAFVHHYEKYGVTKPDLLQAIDHIDDVVADYNAIIQ